MKRYIIPTSAKYDGRLRKIEVKLARNDLEVDSRTGYFAMPDLKGSGPLTPVESTGLAVLNAQPRPHSFDFHVTAYHFQNDGANSRGTLAFELPGAKLGATADPARKMHKFEVSLFALIRDANGQVVDKYSLDLPYFIADANLAAVRATTLIYTHPVDLPPGHYTVDTAVVDREGSQATAETGQIDVPAPSKGVGISSLVVVEHLEPGQGPGGRRRSADFQGKTRDSDGGGHRQPGYQAIRVLCGVSGQIEHGEAQDPRRVQDRRPGVRAVRPRICRRPTLTGTIPMFVAAATRPGNCELQITALQGKESATEHVQYAVKTQ